VGFYKAALLGSLRFLCKWVARQRGGWRGKQAAETWQEAYRMTMANQGCCDNSEILERIEWLEQNIGVFMCECVKKSCCDNTANDADSGHLPPDTGGNIPQSCDRATWIVSDFILFVLALKRVAIEGNFTLAGIKAVIQKFPVIRYVFAGVYLVISISGSIAANILSNVLELLNESKTAMICAIINATSDTSAREAVYGVIDQSGYSALTKTVCKALFAWVDFLPFLGSRDTLFLVVLHHSPPHTERFWPLPKTFFFYSYTKYNPPPYRTF